MVNDLDILKNSLTAASWIFFVGMKINLAFRLLTKHWSGFLVVFTLTATIYAFSAAPFIEQQSDSPHYVYLADAFLHGRSYIAPDPPDPMHNDWSYYDRKWYVAFPPMPAFLMLPFVFVFGREFNDVIFTLLFGAINVALFYHLIPIAAASFQISIPIGKYSRILLTLVFGFGTNHWWLSCAGQVWFTAQIIATTFLLLAMVETLSCQRPLLITTYLAFASLARPTMLLSLPVFIWFILKSTPWRKLLLSVLPLIIVGLGFAYYNTIRFGDFLEMGYRYMFIDDVLTASLDSFGPFNPVFIPKNFYYAFLDLPELHNEFPFIVLDGWGLSMFLSTPLLLYAFRVDLSERVIRFCLSAIVLIAFPSLLYYNSGYLQAGYRYALDYLPLMMVLIINGMRGYVSKAVAVLSLLSCFMGLISLINFVYLYWEF